MESAIFFVLSVFHPTPSRASCGTTHRDAVGLRAVVDVAPSRREAEAAPGPAPRRAPTRGAPPQAVTLTRDGADSSDSLEPEKAEGEAVEEERSHRGPRRRHRRRSSGPSIRRARRGRIRSPERAARHPGVCSERGRGEGGRRCRRCSPANNRHDAPGGGGAPRGDPRPGPGLVPRQHRVDAGHRGRAP